jgi:hypothetical protein
MLRLREWTFGSRLTSVATCATCAERLELDFSVSDIWATPEVEPEAELALSTDGFDVRFRLPDSLDLMAISGVADVARAQQTLLRRCVLSAHHNGDEQAIEALPEPIAARIAECMEQADPQANVQLSLVCPACGQEWRGTFDIVSYFWNEISAWAQDVLRDVHLLASAYGWRESDILTLSPWRRQCYLDMITT